MECAFGIYLSDKLVENSIRKDSGVSFSKRSFYYYMKCSIHRRLLIAGYPLKGRVYAAIFIAHLSILVITLANQ